MCFIDDFEIQSISSSSFNENESSLEYKIFTQYYGKLVGLLPVKYITSQLVSYQIIDVHEEEEILNITESSPQAKHLLRKIKIS